MSYNWLKISIELQNWQYISVSLLLCATPSILHSILCLRNFRMVTLFGCLGLEIKSTFCAHSTTYQKLLSAELGTVLFSHLPKHISFLPSRSLFWSSGCCHSELICINKSVNLCPLKIWILCISLAFCPHAGLSQSINSFRFNHTVLVARGSPGWGNTVQKAPHYGCFPN